jgi:hypothetical protein
LPLLLDQELLLLLPPLLLLLDHELLLLLEPGQSTWR